MQGVRSDTHVEIRAASSEDIPRIIELALNSLWKEYVSYEEAERAYRELVAVRWQRQLEHGHARILVAKVPDEFAGFLVFRWWFGWNGWLETIVVHEKHRRKGIGTRLIRALVEKAKNEGYQTICFGANDGEADRFWEKFNVQRFGELYDRNLAGKLQLYYLGV